MNSIALTNQGFSLKKFIHEAFHINNKEYAEAAEIDKEKLKESLYGTSYNLMVLENNWVMGVFMYINGKELIKHTGINNLKLIGVQEEVFKKGICRIINRMGFFKKTEYNITGFWDY